MKGCNHIREQIDEADKPDLLSFEVTGHIAECPDCERFAGERSALRMLVASSARVSAPINFDAVLNARLAEVKARRASWWLGSPVYFRLGAAAAGLAVMVFALQYTGLLSDQSKRSGEPVPIQGVVPAPYYVAPDVSRGVLPLPPPIVDLTPGKRQNSATYATVSGPRSRRGGVRVPTPVYLTAEDGGVVLVRGQNGEMDVQMPTVSVGAQPLLYVRAGQRAVSNIGTSF
jgi:hypothetical protein